MTRLEDLVLYSLAKIIIRYHDNQVQASEKKVADVNPDSFKRNLRICSMELFKTDEIGYSDRLTNLIKKATINYAERGPFLTYLLNQIHLIKSMLARQKPFSEELLELRKDHITQMLISFRQLLLTTQDKTIAVKHSKIEQDASSDAAISLTGLKSTALWGKNLCLSGDLLVQELFNLLDITTLSTDQELKALSESLCEEVQNALLRTEAKNIIIEKNVQLEANKVIIKSQETTISQLTAEIERYDALIKAKDAATNTTKLPLPFFRPPFIGQNSPAYWRQANGASPFSLLFNPLAQAPTDAPKTDETSKSPGAQ